LLFRRGMLSFDQFYERVSGPELADRYRTRQGLKPILIVGGVLAMVGGTIAIGVQVYENVAADLGGHSGSNAGYIAGGVLIPVGFAAMLLADRYNGKLRIELGLDGVRF
jgi:hypothetical protein